MSFSRSTSSYAHILIVDDNPDELRLLVEKLRGSGYRLSIAFDGAQGYDRAVAGKPDLILLDVNMPRMDGFAMCRRLKATPATAAIPVIFLSSDSHLDQRLTGLHSGARDYVLKPYSPEEVLARIQIHLSLSRPNSFVQETAVAGKPDGDQVLVDAAKRYLQGHLAASPSPESLAHLLGTNEKRLSHAFRRCAGMTVFEYLRQERMSAAQRLLTETSLSVVAISAEMGFSSPANFSTAFHKHHGMPPSVFRQAALSRCAAPVQDDS